MKINGTTSGSVTLAAPATGSDVTLTLPGSAGTAALTTDTGLAFITSSTFSAASTVNINNCFTSTYDNYRIVLRCTSSSNFEINMRMRLSGTDNTSANCAYQDLQIANTTVTASRFSGLTSMFVASLSTSNNVISLDLFDPAIAAPTTYHVLGGRAANATTVESRFIVGGHNVSTAYDGLSLLTSSGTISGTARIYGYRNS